MNRSGDADAYLGLLSDVRAALPTAVVRSTFLVGFPGEDDEDFNALRRFQEAARVDWLGAFAYSREEDTPAFSMKGRPPKRVALARKKEIEDAQRPITERALERFVGTAQAVLVEERIESEDLAIARGYMNAPDVDGSIVVVGGDLKAGDVVAVTVTAVRGVDLEASPRAR
jgi:ribosomal protein S12 methylthiotransferase